MLTGAYEQCQELMSGFAASIIPHGGYVHLSAMASHRQQAWDRHNQQPRTKKSSDIRLATHTYIALYELGQ